MQDSHTLNNFCHPPLHGFYFYIHSSVRWPELNQQVWGLTSAQESLRMTSALLLLTILRLNALSPRTKTPKTLKLSPPDTLSGVLFNEYLCEGLFLSTPECYTSQHWILSATSCPVVQSWRALESWSDWITLTILVSYANLLTSLF